MASHQQHRASDPGGGIYQAGAERGIHRDVQCSHPARRDHGRCCDLFSQAESIFTDQDAEAEDADDSALGEGGDRGSSGRGDRAFVR